MVIEKKRECGICKAQFVLPLKQSGCYAKYCSDECRHKARLISLHKYTDKSRFEEQRTCPICSTSFTVRGKRSGQRYCSDKCARREENNKRNAKREEDRPLSKCAYCGQVFKNRGGRIYCSQYCYIESKRPTLIKSSCPICGSEVTQRGRKRKYCSKDCAIKAQEKVYRRNSLTRRALRVTNGKAERINPKEIFERDGWRCQLCGKKVSKKLYKTKGTKRYANAPSLDHIIPLSKGGEHTRANVQCACYQCNCEKGARELGQLRLFG